MAAQQLNVRVGLIFDEKSLAKIERTMRSKGQRLSNIGTELSLSMSLPLAAAGAAAINAAGDIESLTLALESQLGSTAAAAKEFEKLNAAAKKPGIGLEQAVQGSIRLQGVKFSADEARHTIEQMGNAIARTGGTAENLDSVTKQFEQMASKGRVLQEDVSILSENMPALAGLMEKAFGTTNVEAIRDMGVNGKEFVLQITKAAEGLPRVSGGIKNGIGNAMDSLKQSAAKVGIAINTAFDVTGSIETLSGTLLSLAQAFTNLDPVTQKTILGIAGVAIATGPLLKAFGAVQLFGSQLVGVWGSMVGAGKALIGTTDAMAGALTRVKVAFGVIGLVTGLAFAVYQLSDNFKAAEYASELFAKSQKEIISQTAQEIGLVNQNFAALKDETKGRGEKGAIIDQLLKQYPNYLRGIDLEKASVSELTNIQKGLNDQILRGVAERQKAAAVTSIYEKQAEILLRIQQIRDGAEVTPGEATLINTGDMIRAGSIAEAVIQKMQVQASELGNQVGVVAGQFDKAFGTINRAIEPSLDQEYALRDAYYAQKDAQESVVKTTDKNTNSVKELAAAKRAQKAESKDAAEAEAEEVRQLELYDKMVREIKDAWAQEAEAAQAAMDIRAAQGPVLDTSSQSPGGEQGLTLAPQAEAAPGITAGTNALYAYSEAALYAAEIQQQLNDKTFSFQTGLAGVAETLLAQGNVMGGVFAAMGDAIGQAAASGETSFAKLGQAAVGAAAKIVRAYIQQGVAAAVAKALSSLPFPLNLAAGAAAGGIAAALFTKAIGSIGVKGFARGTKNAPGGVALVGEQGPELINLPRGSQVFPTPQTNAMLSGMGGGNISLDGEFVLRGSDMALIVERAQQKNQRFR